MLMKRSFLYLLLIVATVSVLLSSGCSEEDATNSPTLPASPPPAIEPGQDPPDTGASDEPQLPSKEEPLHLAQDELAQYRPNELGQVMILMYHQIGEPESEWTRTPDNFRRDLEELYRRGYRLVNLLDYVRGDIGLPAGTSPVTLTFDDGSQGQFNFIEGENGPEIDPDSAVGILEQFCQDHPDFGKAATFYIYYPVPFRQRDYIHQKLEFLRDNGYEIGNHNYTHGNLAHLPREKALEELTLNAKTTAELLPGYEVRSLALPYGASPQDKTILATGEHEGFVYTNEAVLKVGAGPAASPFATGFDSMALPRIRASETKVNGVGFYDWLEYFEAYPERRYVSDGKPGLLTAPEKYRDKLNVEAAGEKEIQFYSLHPSRSGTGS